MGHFRSGVVGARAKVIRQGRVSKARDGIDLVMEGGWVKFWLRALSRCGSC